MKVKQVLTSIREKTSLTDQEYAELEKLFTKFVILNFLDQLEGVLSQEQKEQVMDQVQQFEEKPTPTGIEKISSVLKQFGIHSEKTQHMLGLAQEFAFQKITESLQQ